MEGMVASSVPVLDNAGRYFASIAFHGPIQRVSLETAVQKRHVMRDAAAKLSKTLFGDA
jgi:DNA-binding IclR family transcriptional regulator